MTLSMSITVSCKGVGGFLRWRVLEDMFRSREIKINDILQIVVRESTEQLMKDYDNY